MSEQTISPLNELGPRWGPGVVFEIAYGRFQRAKTVIALKSTHYLEGKLQDAQLQVQFIQEELDRRNDAGE